MSKRASKKFFIHYNTTNRANFGAPRFHSWERQTHALGDFLYEINSEQLLSEAFFDVMRIFDNVEPQSESNFPFLYIIKFQTY